MTEEVMQHILYVLKNIETKLDTLSAIEDELSAMKHELSTISKDVERTKDAVRVVARHLTGEIDSADEYSGAVDDVVNALDRLKSAVKSSR